MPLSIVAATTTILDLLAEAEKDAPLVITFIQSTVAAVELTGQSGPDKLTAVLNATEVFVNALIPALSQPLEALMAAVSAFVDALVVLYNDAKVFLHAVHAA